MTRNVLLECFNAKRTKVFLESTRLRTHIKERNREIWEGQDTDVDQYMQIGMNDSAIMFNTGFLFVPLESKFQQLNTTFRACYELTRINEWSSSSQSILLQNRIYKRYINDYKNERCGRACMSICLEYFYYILWLVTEYSWVTLEKILASFACSMQLCRGFFNSDAVVRHFSIFICFHIYRIVSQFMFVFTKLDWKIYELGKLSLRALICI